MTSGTIIINQNSGNCNKIDAQKLSQKLFDGNAEIIFAESNAPFNVSNGNSVVVCGGDGTLNNALPLAESVPIFYIPCGTLNEASKKGDIYSVGVVKDKKFAYVCACGSFTEIGYTATTANKKRFKALAYLPKVISSYKVHNIKATIDINDKVFSGSYTLIMLLRSKCCFGLNFNKTGNCNTTHLLAIKSNGKNTLLNKIRMFFTFFRVFFVGVNKPTIAKNWLMLPLKTGKIVLNNMQDFCIDGEKVTLGGTLDISEEKLKNKITIIKTKNIR